MQHRLVRGVLAALLVAAPSVVTLVPVPAAGAATPVSLLVPQSTAFGILGRSCGGIQEQVIGTGFDASTGYPTAAVYLQTRCGGSGRGGGYHVTTYSAWTADVWDDTGVLLSLDRLASAPAGLDPAAAFTDASGNTEANSLNAINVAPSVCGVGNTTYCTYRSTLTLADGYVPRPRVTAISTANGPATGGTTVTITGTGFTGATAVDFGATPAATFAVVSDTSMTAVAPAAAPAAVDVTVTTPGGTSLPSAADTFTFVGAPTITGIDPASGPVTGGSTVTITGTGFTTTSAVRFGDANAGFAIDSDTSMTVYVPGWDAVEPVDVRITNVGGTSARTAADVYTYTVTGCAGSCVGIGDASVMEGDAGTHSLVFAVTLSTPATTPVSVPYLATDVSATGGTSATTGADFKAVAGTLTFTPGANGLSPVMKNVTVPVFGDTSAEGDETLVVTLGAPTGGYVTGRDTGTGTIVDDDGIVAGPTLGIGDAAVVQTTSGRSSIQLPVTLSAPVSGSVSVTYTVTPIDAVWSSAASGGGDFGGKLSGVITFASRARSRSVTLPVWSDPNADTTKTFLVTLSSVSDPSVTLLRDTGTGTILAL